VNAADSSSPGWIVRRAPWVVAAAAMVVFAVSLNADFVYDDLGLLHNDPRMHDPSRWWVFLVDAYNEGAENLYRPIASLSLAMQWWVHGPNPWAFHLVNWLLHSIVSVLVFAVASKLMPRGAALAAGLLFAVHPVHVEPVVGVFGRAELLCAAFSLGALLLLSAPLTPRSMLGVIGCLVGAVASKEQGILLLPVALGWWWLIGPRTPGSIRPRVLFASTAVLLACYVAWRESFLRFGFEKVFLDHRINPLVDVDWPERGVWVLALAGRYLELLVMPWRFSLDYGGSTIRPDSIYTLLGAAALLAWATLAFRAVRQRDRTLGAALLGFTFFYGLVSGGPLIGTIMAERLIYLPSAFFIIIAVHRLRRVSWTHLLVIPLLALGAVRTIDYARSWHDRLDLYRAQVQTWPQNVRLRILLANELVLHDLDEADRESLHAVQLEPAYDMAWLIRANVLIEQDRIDEARHAVRTAIQVSRLPRPDNFEQLVRRPRVAPRRPD
jgi:hypothetical protein